jgi:hypothetical protein
VSGELGLGGPDPQITSGSPVFNGTPLASRALPSYREGMSCAAHALDVPEAFCWAFAALGILVSFFYGICAVTIAFRPPEFRNPNQFIRSREVWTQCLKDVFRHPWYLDQAWFNFAGSVLGWSSLGCAIWRVRRPPYSFGLAEAGLFLVGQLG